MKLHETNVWWQKLDAIENIEKYLKTIGIKEGLYYINPETLEVTVYEDVHLGNKGFSQLPNIKWKHITGYFNCADNILTNDCLHLLPERIDKCLTMNNNKITSLHDIHHYVKFIGEALIVDPNVTHVLGVFFIKGLERVSFRSSVRTSETTTRMKIKKRLEDIVNRNLESGDIHSCQEELIAAGFGDAAKI